MDGAKLQAVRYRKGYSLRELGEVAGMSWVTIWRIEQGQRARPRPSTLRKIAAALEVDTRELLKDDK